MSQTFVLEYWQDEGWYVGRLKGVPASFIKETHWTYLKYVSNTRIERR